MNKIVKISDKDKEWFEDIYINKIKNIEDIEDEDIDAIIEAIAEMLGYEKKGGRTEGKAKAKLLKKINDRRFKI